MDGDKIDELVEILVKQYTDALEAADNEETEDQTFVDKNVTMNTLYGLIRTCPDYETRSQFELDLQADSNKAIEIVRGHCHSVVAGFTQKDLNIVARNGTRLNKRLRVFSRDFRDDNQDQLWPIVKIIRQVCPLHRLAGLLTATVSACVAARFLTTSQSSTCPVSLY